MLQTKGLNAVNRKQFREALLNKGEALIDAENEFISPDISLARPSEKVVWDGEQFVTVPANEPAWHVDFETGEKVLLVEGEAINLFPKSNDLTVLNRPNCRFEYDAIDKCTAVYYADNIAASVYILPPTFDSNSPFVFSFDFKFNLDFSGYTGSIAFGAATGIEGNRWSVQFNTDFSHQTFGREVSSTYSVTPLADGWNRVVMFAGFNEGVTHTQSMKIRGSGGMTDTGITDPFIWFRNVNVVQGAVASSPITTTGIPVARAADTITYTGATIASTQLLETSSGTVATDSGLPLNTQEAAIQKLTKLPITLTELGSSRFNSGLDEEDYFAEIEEEEP